MKWWQRMAWTSSSLLVWGALGLLVAIVGNAAVRS